MYVDDHMKRLLYLFDNFAKQKYDKMYFNDWSKSLTERQKWYAVCYKYDTFTSDSVWKQETEKKQNDICHKLQQKGNGIIILIS